MARQTLSLKKEANITDIQQEEIFQHIQRMVSSKTVLPHAVQCFISVAAGGTLQEINYQYLEI